MKALTQFSTLSWCLIAGLFVVLIGANTYLSRTTVKELNQLQFTIRYSDDVVKVLQEIHVSILTAESGQRGFLLTKDIKYLQHYENATIHISFLWAQAQELIQEGDIQFDNLSTFFEIMSHKLAELESTITAAKNNDFAGAVSTVNKDEGRALYAQLRVMFDNMQETEATERAKQIAELKLATAESQRNIIISFFTSILLVVGLLVLARANLLSQKERRADIESQNIKLKSAVEERTKELSLFSDELARSNRELEDFAFVASHDLQEPLRKIMAFGDRLSASDNLEPKQQDYLERMRGAASRMSTLISDLLEFSRVTTRGKPFQFVDLKFVMVSSIDDLNILIDETNAQVTFDELPSINADPTQMQQLFFNLISNAIKFSSEQKHPEVTITATKIQQPEDVEVEDLDDWYKFTIKDNGIGFDQEHAEKIFAPFQRLHSRQEFKGTGIGLAICRRIVERHNGVIRAFGKVNEGATFEICLPAENRLISIKK